jgi:hypothetical protein
MAEVQHGRLRSTQYGVASDKGCPEAFIPNLVVRIVLVSTFDSRHAVLAPPDLFRPSSFLSSALKDNTLGVYFGKRRIIKPKIGRDQGKHIFVEWARVTGEGKRRD